MNKIPHHIIKAYNNFRQVKKKKPICRAPFSNLYFSRTGHVFSCCFNRDFPIGTYPDQKPLDIWKGKRLKTLKRGIKNNNLDYGCSMCKNELLNKNYQGVMAKHFDFLKPKTKYPVMMEFELDNTCNLECIMCDGSLSSSIRKNRDNKPKINTPYDDNFLEYIKPLLKKTQLLRFSGGEPFLIPMYYDIWDTTIKNNPNANFFVQTNGTIINDKIRNYIASGKFDIGVSIDSLNKEKFEYIRKNAKLDTVLKNIDEFIHLLRKQENNRALIISCTVTRENWQDIPDVLEYANSIHSQIVFNTVWDPYEHAVHNLPSGQLYEIHQFLSDYDIPVTTKTEKHNKTMFESQVNQIHNWYLKNKDYENRIKALDNLSASQIKTQMLKRIKIEQQPKHIAEKIHHLFDVINNEPLERKKLEIIYKYPDPQIISVLKNWSFDDILHELNVQVKGS
ncbi:MAG: radical SAM protein [Bacteroidota bacterium]|nr:radical SAM protein [Bacteroidota bacterium]